MKVAAAGLKPPCSLTDTRQATLVPQLTGELATWVEPIGIAIVVWGVAVVSCAMAIGIALRTDIKAREDMADEMMEIILTVASCGIKKKIRC